MEITPWKSYLKSSCLGQLNTILNPCGKVWHRTPQLKWDVMMRMEDFTSSLNVLICIDIFLYIYVLYILFPCHAFLMLGQNNGSKT